MFSFSSFLLSIYQSPLHEETLVVVLADHVYLYSNDLVHILCYSLAHFVYHHGENVFCEGTHIGYQSRLCFPK